MPIRRPRFEFSTSEELLKILERDYEELRVCSRGRAYKASIVLAGSILETALLESLKPLRAAAETTSSVNHNAGDKLEVTSLAGLLELSEVLKVLPREQVKMCDGLRDYRNLIHPAVEIRKGVKPTREKMDLSTSVLREALSTLDNRVKGKVFVVGIAGLPRHWIDNPVFVAEQTIGLLKHAGVEYEQIQSWSDWDDLIRNPPPNVLVVNCHGEAIPIPASWRGDWKAMFTQLSENCRLHGWTLASIMGYPLYMVSNESSLNLQAVGPEGFNFFLSFVGAFADCGTPARATISSRALKSIRSLESSIPSTLQVGRCARFKGARIKDVYLTTRGLFGACLLRIGRGSFYHQGIMPPDLGQKDGTPDTDKTMAILLHVFLTASWHN